MVNALLVSAPLNYGHDRCSQNKELSYEWLDNLIVNPENIPVPKLRSWTDRGYPFRRITRNTSLKRPKANAIGTFTHICS